MLQENIKKYITVLCLLAYAVSAKQQQQHRDHKNKRGLFTSDGVIYSELVVTSTMEPTTIYYTSYWTSYWTSIITQYSTIVYSDYTSTKTLVTPTTYETIASSSYSTVTSEEATSDSATISTSSATTSSSSSSVSTSTSSSSTSTSSAQTTTSDLSSISLAGNFSTLFEEVASPYYLTSVNNGTTTVYYIEDVWYNDSGSATTTNYEKYIGTDSTIPYLATTFYTTSTSTVTKTITITTSTS